MVFRPCNIPLLILLLACPLQPAHAAMPLTLKARFELNFLGIPFGMMGVEMTQTASRYAMTTDVTSTGIAKMIANHRSHTEASGDGHDFSYPNRRYQTYSQTRKKKRDIGMIYKKGAIVSETVVPPDNRTTRPAVADSLRSAAYDPLLMVLEIRKRSMEASKTNANGFSLDLYDGRRLSRLDATMQGIKVIRVGGAKKQVVAVSLRRTLKDGFTAGELADYDPKEPPLTIYFSNDERFIPLLLSLPFPYGSVTATLNKECAGAESCLL